MNSPKTVEIILIIIVNCDYFIPIKRYLLRKRRGKAIWWIWLSNLLRPRFINFPKEREEIDEVRPGFNTIACFPKCIGAIDCTHVKIISPGGEQAETYRNRKGFFSINVQTVCDAHLRIQDIVARWPGSAHDSTIFINSSLRGYNCSLQYSIAFW